MPNLQERAQELVNERQQAITRIAEINGALYELDRLAQDAEANEIPNPSEEENNG